MVAKFRGNKYLIALYRIDEALLMSIALTIAQFGTFRLGGIYGVVEVRDFPKRFRFRL